MREVALLFDDGLVAHNVNGKCKIVFNPADVGFIRRLAELAEQLGDIQTRLEEQIRTRGEAAVFEVAEASDAEMRGKIDAVLGEGTCAALFDAVNVFALAEGLPVWANLIFALMDRCEGDIVRQQELTSPRLEKYTAKYRKK